MILTAPPRPDVRFWIEARSICVETHFDHKEKVKAVDGARWDSSRGIWTVPADGYTALLLKEQFKGMKASADLAFRDLLQATPDVLERVNRTLAAREYSGPEPQTQLWPHQQNAVERALVHEGFYFAHDMGAGKSLSSIAVLLKRDEKLPTLILCPKRVISSWVDQFQRHAGDHFVVVPLLKGSVKARTELAAQAVKDYSHVVIVVNYDAARQPAFKEWSLKQQWGHIICDEAHRAKAPGGVTSKYLATLSRRAQYRLCLSGTPMPHGPLDIYAQYRFLDPQVFGTNYARFKARYAVEHPEFKGMILDYLNEDELNAKFYTIADRVMTRDVVWLPEERDEVLYAELSPTARTYYDELEGQFWTMVDQVGDDPGEVSIRSILTLLIRLQQITSGYLRDDTGADHEIDSTKAALLADLLEDMPTDEPLVIFARFAHDLAAIRQVVERAGRTHGELSGRHDDYGRWQAGEIHTLAVQLQAGGEGLNDLVRARYCVYYSVDHSLKNYVQSRARIMRPGQKQNCVYYHLVCSDTIDQKIYDTLAKRQEVVEGILRKRGT